MAQETSKVTSKVSVGVKRGLRGRGAASGPGHVGPRVLRDALLEEVGLARKRHELHPVEGVGGVVELWVPEREQKPIGHVLDVLRHELGIHAHEGDGQRVLDEVPLDLDGVADDLVDDGVRELRLQALVQRAGKVAMQALVARDELVCEAEARQQAALAEPEDGAERAREEDAFDGRKRDEALGVRRLRRRPALGPLRLLPDAGHELVGVEQRGSFVHVGDVRLEQQRVHFLVHGFDGNLKTVEEAGLGQRHLGREALHQILQDDAVRRREKGEHSCEKVTLAVA
mmetsp:Transcript_20425/g.70531  ORF Transcript_20425/g.70531 Transcript_20425/m.70531 type:complete len:285 (+) Transcript_20425:914-1768(+)